MLVRVGDLRATPLTAPARDVPSHSAVLAARYREAVKASYIADRVRSRPGVDAATAPAAVDVAAAPRAGSWDRIALAAYLAALTIAELAVTFVNPLLVFPLHGGIVGLAAMHVALLEGRSGWQSGVHRMTRFLLVFIVVASIRIISLTLPLAAIEPAYRYLFAAVPMTLGALLVARAADFSMRDVGLAWRRWRLQAIVIVASIGLGFIEFAILRPAPIGPLPWVAAGVIPAVVVIVATGVPEELIFRGFLQTATRPILGRLNWIYASLVFAVLHIGYKSLLDLAFVFGVGLLYGWVFERSRSIVGVSIGHGLVNVILFFIAPNLPAVAMWLGI
jgi:membrane protease YdiL (CAAX protease family)